jgi:hypothetical protein
MFIIPFAVFERASFLSEGGQRKEAKEDRLFLWTLF